ncbi:MAG: 23S rRNA (uracil(1939)-C(5))-methyltransferase RlmD [Thioalkalivibrionaceae bacterium]
MRAKPVPTGATIEFVVRDWTLQGDGVAQRVSPDGSGGRVEFVARALPGERVTARFVEQRAGVARHALERVIVASADRVTPFCSAFERCGGCGLQYATLEAQRSLRDRTLFETLNRIGRAMPEQRLPVLAGSDRGYRRAARLSVADRRRARLREDDGGPPVRVGFRARQGDAVAPIMQCAVLHPAIGEQISALRELLSGLSVAAAIPQIEVAVDDAGRVGAILRHLRPLNAADREALLQFAASRNWIWWLQPEGPASVHRLDEPARGESLSGDEPGRADVDAPLRYAHPDFDVVIDFHPQDFIQAHGDLNREMVARAVDWLDLAPGLRVIDAFCGLGNFSLPIARRVGPKGQVWGLEADQRMLARAAAGARSQGIDWTHYSEVDLFDPAAIDRWVTTTLANDWASGDESRPPFDRMLIDPPRAGAAEWLPVAARLRVPRVVYVSCNPASLARDAGRLVNEFGYRLIAAGTADMFPHTAHVESIAVFVRERPGVNT